MYTAKLVIGIDHHGDTLTPDLTTGMMELLNAEAEIVNSDVDFKCTYILHGDGGVYLRHYLKIYLYGETLFIDPDDFFKQVFDGVKAKSGKDMFYLGDIETDVPDVESRKCPTCLGVGTVVAVSNLNIRFNSACPSDCIDGRLPIDQIGSAQIMSGVEYLCRDFCYTNGIKTKVLEGVAKCEDCEQIRRQEVLEQKVRNEKWLKEMIAMEIHKKNSSKTMEEINHHKEMVNRTKLLAEMRRAKSTKDSQ